MTYGNEQWVQEIEWYKTLWTNYQEVINSTNIGDDSQELDIDIGMTQCINGRKHW